ncbi:hypothetical protein [Ruegeria marina]|uniref:HEAT repeat domain-containing protein n=1 Tax=Ruegeria marina TaxID=639004 RepID=A0A1G6NJP8_9RHOB|nr:hypothetical protein [Ruegeria marina]SDC67989.1 hypothetical protein SAMN04488239_103143 [Ruegeria marina]
MRKLISFLGATLILVLAAGEARACGFHGYLPERTVIDRMLESDHIVLARADPENPFRFVAVEAIRGSLDGVEIPQLVDSLTRRRLNLGPQDRVMFARDGGDGTWVQLAYVDAAFRSVLDRIVPRLESWAAGDQAGRFQFFADLLHHPDRRVDDLVLAELDQAPYAVFDRLSLAPDTALLTADFYAPHRFRMIPIRVLLLGKSPDPAAAAFLRAKFAGGRSPTGSMAGAYAVALIESQGRPGADRIAALLRAGPAFTPETREVLVEALALHSLTGEPDLQSHVRGLVAALLRDDPALAGAVARRFGALGDRSQVEPLRALAQAGMVAADGDRLAVEQYLKPAI